MGESPISFDSRERVAYDLMKTIVAQEKIKEKQGMFDRNYHLKLFAQCLLAVRGISIEEVLKQ